MLYQSHCVSMFVRRDHCVHILPKSSRQYLHVFALARNDDGVFLLCRSLQKNNKKMFYFSRRFFRQFRNSFLGRKRAALSIDTRPERERESDRGAGRGMEIFNLRERRQREYVLFNEAYRSVPPSTSVHSSTFLTRVRSK